MPIDALLERLLFAAAVVLVMAGAVTAWTAANATRKLAGVSVAMLGALVALAALGAPAWTLAAGAAIALAQLVTGAAVAVRLQESYASSEIDEADRAEAEAERGP